MPATGVRCTMVFKAQGYSVGESHVLVSATTIETARIPALNLVKARMMLMAQGTSVKSVRLSKESVRNDSRVFDQRDLIGIRPPNIPVGDASGVGLDPLTDQGKAAYQLRLEAGDLHRAPLYLAGIPDYIIRFDANQNPIAPPAFWNTWLDLYRDELKKGWGFVGRSDAAGALAARDVISFGSNMDQGGNFFVVTNSVGSAYTQGSKIQLRGFRLTNVAYVSPNGRWQLLLVEADTPSAGKVRYTLRNSSSISPGTVTLAGTIEPVDFTTFAYDQVVPVGATTRKRGNRSLLPPGKRSVRRKVSA